MEFIHDIRIIAGTFRLFPLEEHLKFAKAVEVQFLGKADDCRRRNVTGLGQLMNRAVADAARCCKMYFQIPISVLLSFWRWALMSSASCMAGSPFTKQAPAENSAGAGL